MVKLGQWPAARWGLAVVLGVWLATVYCVNQPGHLSVDSLIQIAEGRSGVYESYNPLFISAVLGQLTALSGGTAVLVLISAAAFAVAAWLLLGRIARPGLPGLLASAALLFMPILLIYPGIVWKDVWFAHAALLGFALIPVRARAAPSLRWKHTAWWLEAACLCLFAFAMLSRQTGVLVSAVGVVTLTLMAQGRAPGARGLIRDGKGWLRLALGLLVRLAVLVALAQTMSLAAQTSARTVTGAPVGTGVRQVAIFDIAGMLQRLPAARLERLAALDVDTATFEREGRRLFSAERVDTLDMPPIRGLWHVPLAQVLGQWFDLAAGHPIAYLAHRGEVYAWLLGLRDQARCLPVFTGIASSALAARAGVDATPPPYAQRLHGYAMRFIGTPYFSPLAWGLVSLAVLFCLHRRGALYTPMGGLQCAGLVYLASYAPISLSCDFRYTYFSVAAASLGLMHLVLTASARRVPAGVNFIGYARGGLGLGENLRRFAEAAREGGYPFALIDFNANLGERGRDHRLDAWIQDTNPYPVNVFFVNADQMATARAHFGERFLAGRRNIGFWFWELETFPEPWRSALDQVDEVWVASRFVAAAIGAHTTKPVRRLALPVSVPLPRPYTRAEFGLPPSGFAFLFSFDFHSYAQRKNPLATIAAFRRAFPLGTEPALLVVKSTNGARVPALLAQVQAAADSDPRIVLIDAFLDRDAAMGLVSVVDSYVSLHRAEGFGLGIAEAMWLGKPVIATAYSGNMDFTRPDNSCLVSATMVPVGADEYPFGEGQHWAEPDLDQAAGYMQRLVAEPAWASALGQAGAGYIRRHHSNEACVVSLKAALAGT